MNLISINEQNKIVAIKSVGDDCEQLECDHVVEQYNSAYLGCTLVDGNIVDATGAVIASVVK